MGIIRVILALMVVLAHAQGTILGVHGLSPLASVNFFFVISGFYMALVLNEKYGPSDNRLFWLNRLLRIYPTFLLALLIAATVGAVIFLTDGASERNWSSPVAAPTLLLMNLFVIGQDFIYVFCIPDGAGACLDPVASSLNPPAWSLVPEMLFYLCAPFMVRSRYRTILFSAAGIIYLLAVSRWHASLLSFWQEEVNPQASGLSLSYYFLPASFMYFGLGALSYHMRDLARQREIIPATLVGISIIAAMTLARPEAMLQWHHTLFVFFLVPVLFEVTRNNRFDQAIGEISYPIYILHFPILTIIRAASGVEGGDWVGYMVIGITVPAAVLVARYFERPIERYRLQRYRIQHAR